ncbi:hypothetical protein QCA50_013344 [Cerrena zonata]|uniref:BTB domain-containing protein n=1 Tax=Cerrena zonata TaxID=2478898 RepID=A0AAW0FX92_9APHY
MELNTAYETSLVEGYFIDTVFYLYSCKSLSTGKVHKPRPVYASSKMLISASPYFATLLSGKFQEGKFGKLDGGFPEGEVNAIDDYEYDSDSDLDEEEEEVLPIPEEIIIPPMKPIQGVKDIKGPTFISTSDESDDSGSCSSSVPSETARRPVASMEYEVPPIPFEVASPEPPACKDWVREGRIVIIRGFAYATWLSMIRYLGTKETSFAPLQSLNRRHTRSLFDCSPKSMYRLAHLLELEDVKRLAVGNLRAQLHPTIIFPELFSLVGTTYPDVTQVLVDYFISYRRDSQISKASPEWIMKVASGAYADRSAAFSSVFTKLIR